MVTTFPVEDAATPAWSVTPVDGQLECREGRFIGYRGHAAGRAPEPSFWFGQGLGYASWKYSHATPGEAVRAVVRTESRMYRRWDTVTGTWQSLTGGGELLIARGLCDIRATLELPPGAAYHQAASARGGQPHNRSST